MHHIVSLVIFCAVGVGYTSCVSEDVNNECIQKAQDEFKIIYPTQVSVVDREDHKGCHIYDTISWTDSTGKKTSIKAYCDGKAYEVWTF